MLAVIQTSVTFALAGSPLPVNVTAAPGFATSGFVVITFIVAAGLPGSTSGPGSGAAPGMIGVVTAVGSAQPPTG